MTLPSLDYHGKIHWHDDRGRLTIDACSHQTSDGSSHPRFSAEFAYYSLPIIWAPILQAWIASRSSLEIPPISSSTYQTLRHELALPEFLSIPKCVTPPRAARHDDLPGSEGHLPHHPNGQAVSPRYYPHPLGQGNIPYSTPVFTPFDASYYETPPIRRRVNFVANS